MKKPVRGDAKLKLLPKERQKGIIEYRDTHSHEDTLAWLAADGIEVAPSTLTDFYQWFYFQRDLEEAADFADVSGAKLAEVLPDLAADADKLRRATQVIFELRSAKRDDPKTWALMRQVDQFERGVEQKEREIEIKGRAIALKEEKFRRDTAELFVKWFDDKRAQDILAGRATNSEKIEALGQLMFGEDWKK